MNQPYPLPETMSPSLLRVNSYWENLKRGGNNMPFWDDVDLSVLPDLTDRIILIDVFANPERFRFNFVGKEFMDNNGEPLINKFADEVELRGRLNYLRSQSSATVEAGEPTFFSHESTDNCKAYSRILLPMWGDGRIGMLLGSFDPL